MGHNDVTPENVVFRDGVAVALIDFDLAHPLADAYGLSGSDRERIIAAGMLRTRQFWSLMKHRAEAAGGDWQRMWDESVGDAVQRWEAWQDRHAATLTAALTAP